jgi:diacylglycerol kinase family enzyme
MNNISDIDFKNDIYFYPAGTGNDFVKNLNSDYKIKMFDAIDDLKSVKADLPILTHHDKERHFINGIGLGFDGEVAKTVNTSKMKNTFSYFTTAVKTIFSFKTFSVEVTVDKEVVKLDNVWLVAIQNGKYFGGGMMICPKASLSDEKLDICVVHSLSKMKFLKLLPSVFSGNHLKHHQYIYYNQGSKISVELDQAKCGQIDGDLLNETTAITASIKKKFFDIF